MFLPLLLTFQLETVSSVYTSPWDLKKRLCSKLVFPPWNACLKISKHFTAGKTSNSWINLNLFWALPLAVCSESQPVKWIPQFPIQNKSDITCLMGASQGYYSGPKLQVQDTCRRTTGLCFAEGQNHDFSWLTSNSMNQSVLCNPEMKNAM